MKQWTPTNWGATLPPAAAIPTAFCTGVLAADGLRCGSEHLAVVLLITGLPILLSMVVFVLIAMIAVQLWSRKVPLRHWRIGCAILTLVALVTGASLILFDPNPTFCRLDF